MKVEFKGGKELEAALGELASQATRKNVAKRALRKAGEPIRAEWERLAPEDEGDLKRAIKVGEAIRGYRTGGDVVTQFVGIDESQDRRLHIYAEVQEFGNGNHPAQPAGRPAWETKKQEAMDRLADDLWAEINQAAQRAARKAARVK